MKLKERIEKAVGGRRSEQARIIVDFLRFRHGFMYQEIYDFVNARAPIALAEWDALLDQRQAFLAAKTAALRHSISRDMGGNDDYRDDTSW
jgi:hypothetical protein